MNKIIVKNYNDMITDDDIVIHLGDLSATVKPYMSEFENILKSLKGQKILLRGNHDHQSGQFYQNNGFGVVGDHLIINEYFFSHYPLSHRTKEYHSEEKRLIELYKKSGCTKIVHGHTHNNVSKWDDDKYRINACVEANDYRPLMLEI